ncbi:MAG: hypothetical protein JNK85_09440 [Verrucomicrobiales bacterium]|nr:hypothetical protein [Verrucomicrobiales bacterium]
MVVSSGGPSEATPAPDIAVQAVRVGEIEAFTRDFFRQPDPGSTAPITPERARSLANNPHAQPEDLAVVLALEGTRCVGFQQVFPGALRLQDGVARVFWFCGGFVVPEMRNRGVFARLVQAIQKEGADLISTAYSEGVARTLKRLGFQEAGPVSHAVVHLRKAHLGRRTRIAALANVGDMRGWCARRVARLVASRITTPLESRPMLQVADLPDGSQLGNAGIPRFDRDATVINWMLSHPWVRDDAPAVAPAFYFGDRREVFRYERIELIAPGGRVRGFGLASYQKTKEGARWTMLDHQMDSPELLANLLAWQWARIVQIGGIDDVLLPAAAWQLLESSAFFKALACLYQRPYLAHPASATSPLARSLKDLHFQFVDCDSAFS